MSFLTQRTHQPIRPLISTLENKKFVDEQHLKSELKTFSSQNSKDFYRRHFIFANYWRQGKICYFTLCTDAAEIYQYYALIIVKFYKEEENQISQNKLQKYSLTDMKWK